MCLHRAKNTCNASIGHSIITLLAHTAVSTSTNSSHCHPLTNLADSGDVSSESECCCGGGVCTGVITTSFLDRGCRATFTLVADRLESMAININRILSTS